MAGAAVLARVVAVVEAVGAVVLAAIATLTFVSVMMRYVFNAPVPDAFDFSRMLMGVVILWGVASASYFGDHIRFDVLWTIASPLWKRVIDVVATLVTLGAVAVLSVMLAIKVHDTYLDQTTTSGLSIVLWPFQLFAWIGAAAATLLLVARSLRLVLEGPFEAPDSPAID